MENFSSWGLICKSMQITPNSCVSRDRVFKLYFIFFAVLGLELRAFTLSHSTSPSFVMGFFEIGSCELFVWAGFEL
jgi:hypothetical protein